MTGPDKSIPFDLNKALKRLLIIVTIGLTGNLFYTFFSFDAHKATQLLQFSGGYLALALLLAIYPWVAHAWEIQVWTHLFRKKLTFYEALNISVATDLGSAITPTMLGGAPLKIIMLINKGLKKGEAASMVTFTALEDVIYLLLTIPVSLLVLRQWNHPVVLNVVSGAREIAPFLLMAVLVMVMTSITLFSFRKQIKSRFSSFRIGTLASRIRLVLVNTINEFRLANATILKHGRIHFLLALLAICSRWISRYLLLVCLAIGLGTDTNYIYLFFMQWMVYAAMTITPTPGAMGGAEAAFFFVFQSILPPATISIIMTGWRFLTYYLILILALIYVNIVHWTGQKRARVSLSGNF